MTTSEKVDKADEEFTAVLRKSPAPRGWTYLVWPESVTFFGLSKAEIRKAIGKEGGATVTVRPAGRFRS
ncbi:hypothetical protein PV396_09745 [Streptomyces sp. ME02-8801-2C]|uniref:hypothetical protein n=1 Tax=Streptomyces sp. ME02-8801-2C TaxID=3028680 RepID=UPI0029AE9C24|nr:hypothetical protein [Streptomyces sp. ME02-8801-2C]MDX3452218.1 hypothetical protein [Streptomyces sp. ME02-8801-2C]